MTADLVFWYKYLLEQTVGSFQENLDIYLKMARKEKYWEKANKFVCSSLVTADNFHNSLFWFTLMTGEHPKTAKELHSRECYGHLHELPEILGSKSKNGHFDCHSDQADQRYNPKCPSYGKSLWDNNGGDRPTQLLSTCFSQLRVWLERVYLLRICPFCMKRSGDLEKFR